MQCPYCQKEMEEGYIPYNSPFILKWVSLEDKKKAYKVLCDLGVKNLIITLGSKGSICFAGSEVIEVKANKVDAIDTTAAGDTFVGTLASKLINNASLKEAKELTFEIKED